MTQGARSAAKASVEYSPSKQQLRTLWKEDNKALWVWWNYCSERGIIPADFDIKKIEDAVILEFLSAFNKGVLPQIQLPSNGLIKELDEVRKNDGRVRWHWAQYCSTHAFGISNPLRLPANIISDFLRTRKSLPKFDFATEEQVKKITLVQKLGGSPKWQEFCRKQCLGSTTDPRSMPADLVQEFLDTYTPAEADDTRTVSEGQPAEDPNRRVTAKTKLNGFVERRLKRNLTPADIVYTLEQENDKPGKHRASVTLTPDLYKGKRGLATRQFMGEWRKSQKEAIDSAAQTALKAFLDIAAAAASDYLTST